MSFYEFYLKVNKVEHDNRDQHDVNAIDTIEVNDKSNTLT